MDTGTLRTKTCSTQLVRETPPEHRAIDLPPAQRSRTGRLLQGNIIHMFSGMTKGKLLWGFSWYLGEMQSILFREEKKKKESNKGPG